MNECVSSLWCCAGGHRKCYGIDRPGAHGPVCHGQEFRGAQNTQSCQTMLRTLIAYSCCILQAVALFCIFKAMSLVHYCISADANCFSPFAATNCGPTSYHMANHHLCSWLSVGREKPGLGSCSAAGSGAGTVECHGGTSWQRPLQAAGDQSQCTAWGEKLCFVGTKSLMSLVTIDVFGCHWCLGLPSTC